ncbi:MAG: hypothetical protein IT439_00405 [Phycisphaerales bacterium]|nr:hypothetical protein [Phycisphaerales bacterium]
MDRASAFVVALIAGLAQGADLRPPLTVVGAQGPITRLAVDRAAAATLAEHDTAIIRGFPLSPARTIDLALTRAQTIAPGATVLESSANGSAPTPLPSERVYVGDVLGFPGSVVAITVTDELIAGLIDFDGETWVLSAGPGGNSLEPVIYRIDGLPEGLLNIPEFQCRTTGVPDSDPPAGGAGPESEQPCRMVDLAWETDREYLRLLFWDDQAAATAYAQLLTAALTEIYTREVNLRFRISYLNLWTGPDPWNQTSTGEQLTQFQAWFSANRADVDRDLAHMLSGRQLGGGVAWLNAACGGNAYAVSANLGGSFPYPLINNSHQNWDIVVTAHELGHNLGTIHTHDYVPPIDGCGNGDCSLAPQGTIMSYCHTCPGGLSNIALVHPQRVRDAIGSYLTTLRACDLSFMENPVIVEQPQGGDVCVGAPVTLSVLALGEGVTYSWRKNGQIVPGATGPTLSFSAFTAADAGAYQARAGGACGAAFSAFAVLTPTLDADCNGNGLCDSVDIASGTSEDADQDGIPDECACAADLSASSDPSDPGYGHRDGLVDSADFFYFLDQFTAGNTTVADLSGSPDPNDPAYGQPDGAIDAADFFYFLDLFVAGC